MPYMVVDTLADDEQDQDIELGDNTQDHNEGQSIVKDESKQNDTSITSCTDSDATNKRKRPRKIEKVYKITGIIDKMVQLQKASDKMFCSIEEKRLKFDEVMKMEEARLKEMWERDRKRKEEQEFQLKMMQILCSSRRQIQSPPQQFYGFDSVNAQRGSIPSSSSSMFDWHQNSCDMFEN
uniref:No apical meristem-associated C-terminal domain-containing protein n=1 Tax=Amphimedon queenslandica TaxID=400682 RepID=A0A1X7UTT7_AMPQE